MKKIKRMSEDERELMFLMNGLNIEEEEEKIE